MIYGRATESYATYSNTSVEYQFEVSQTPNLSFCVCHLPVQMEHYYKNGFLYLKKLYENKNIYLFSKFRANNFPSYF